MSNEGKVCDAVVRFLEACKRMRRAEVVRPEMLGGDA